MPLSVSFKELVAWFRTLPPFLDLGNVRTCHAWWNLESIARVGDAMDATGRLGGQAG